jgi:hypothetical protein
MSDQPDARVKHAQVGRIGCHDGLRVATRADHDVGSAMSAVPLDARSLPTFTTDR